MAEYRLEKIEQDADAHEDALYEALDKMNAVERQKIFSDWLQRAMPWIDARLSSDLDGISDRFKCFIGVNHSEQFSKKFKAELVGCIPSG